MNTFDNVINCAATIFGDAGEIVDGGAYVVDFGGEKLALFTSGDDPNVFNVKTFTLPSVHARMNLVRLSLPFW